MKLHIRTADTPDLAALLALYQELHETDPALPDGVGIAALEQILASPGLHLFVASAAAANPAAELLATTYLNIIPNLTRAARPYAVNENVVTLKRMRGQGVGQALMQHTLAFAWQQGCYKAMLQTGSKNPATHHFYRRSGFVSGDKTSYVARPPDALL